MLVRIPADFDQSDAALMRLTRDNPGWRIERSADGDLVVSPIGTKTGPKSLEAAAQLRDYAKRAGGKAYDSSTGFAIGSKAAVKSPNAAWASVATIEAVPAHLRSGYWPLVPDVIIEVKSETDAFSATLSSARDFLDRGSSYAVAIDPDTREVVQMGQAPEGLQLDFDAIVDA